MLSASEAVSRVDSDVIGAFQARLPASLRDKVAILPNSTAELRDELSYGKSRGKGWRDVAMFAKSVRRPMGQVGSSGSARLEENYFYSTRRFPIGTANVIGAGGLAPNVYPFFGKGVNDDGGPLGFPSGFTLGLPETNLEVGGGIPQGSSFVFNQLGITFESDIATGDLATMLDNVTLGFSRAGGQFSINHGPLKFWPSGMGISGFAATSVASTTIAAPHNGGADIRAVRTLRIPRILREKESFQYSFTVTRATKAKDGSTIALSNFVIPTIWLFGGQRNVIPA